MADDEHELTLKVGEMRLVTLESRGAAGLQLTSKIDDDSVVQVERKEYKAPDISKQRIGGPVPAIFAITALRKGETKVTFAESRAWDKNFKEIIQRQIRILVTEP